MPDGRNQFPNPGPDRFQIPSYFATCNQTFDVVAFGLLDSHTTTAMTNARLDHYVYTLESIRHARKLLNPGGVLTLSFVVQMPFVRERLAGTLHEVFGHSPVEFEVPGNGFGGGHAMFVISADEADVKNTLATNPALNSLVTEWQAGLTPLAGGVRVATDDWPYLYLAKPSVPTLYFLLAGLLLGLYAVGRRVMGQSTEAGWGTSGWHFAFLGAGFMLLEVQNVSKAAVILGNTWAVNAVIISGVMVMILLANLIAAKFPKLPPRPVYALLIASCLGLYFFDLSSLAFLPYAAKAAAVGLLTSLPMLFSGIIFIRSFAATERKDIALGANLLGSLFGALLQTVTFLTGVKALLLIVALLYLAAVATRPQQKPLAA